MLQLNLLPDVKKEYIKTKRTKRLILSISSMVSISVFVLLILIFSFVRFAQKKSISDLTKDIDKEIVKVTSTEGINEILTIQNQLKSLPAINAEKPETSRIIDYLKILTPQGVFISSLDLDVTNNTIEITGSSDSLALINTYADTLKFATYKTKKVGDETDDSLIDSGDKPFNSVITDLSRSNENASYTIKLSYDPIIFDNTKVVTVVVPKNTVTTRSVTGQPKLSSDESLFNAPPEDKTGADQ